VSRLGDGATGEVVVSERGEHCQWWGAVRRVAARRLAAELAVNLGRGFGGRHDRRHEFERPPAHRAGVEGPLSPPAEIPAHDVLGIEPTKFEQAFGQARGHADRPAVAIPGSQPQQHASATVLNGGDVAHGPYPARSKDNIVQLPDEDKKKVLVAVSALGK
jgi:hypothetical protein